MAIKKPIRIVTDIQPPKKKKFIDNPASPAESNPPKLKNNKIYFAAGLGMLLFFLTIGVFNFASAIHSANKIFGLETANIKNNLSNLQLGDLNRSLQKINAEIQKVFLAAKNSGIAYLFSLLNRLLENVSELSDNSLSLTQNLEYLEKNAANLIINQEGEELIGLLEQLETDASEIEKNHSEAKELVSQLKFRPGAIALLANFLEKNYVTVNFNLQQLKESINALLAILRPTEDRHFLVIFQNQSEIRPAGGFIGSYADVILNRGSLKELKIDDIYNADRQLNLKLIPPKELRGVTAKWGARDANWFFDFPTSAQKVISLLEESDLFSKNQIRFSGAAAINTKVLATFLELTGPIQLPDYNQTVTSKNFLPVIQYEVEAGRDKKPGQNPKKILSALAPAIFEKLNNLDGNQKNNLAGKIKEHVKEKDIMVYFQDWRLQNIFEDLGMSGSVANLPENFIGDYLAVVNTNIAGGKSDAFIRQHLSLKSEITKEGKIINQLAVTRSHQGEKEKDWWYRATNKNYLKILVPENSNLVFLTGNTRIKINPENRTKYSQEYQNDPELKSIEKTASIIDAFQAWVGKEFGKTFFSAWLNVPAGESKTLTVRYETGVRLNIRPENRYRFIFEKQSGVDGSLEYAITAPPGYVWKESGKPIFEYGTQQIKAREIIDLTLKKI